MKLELWCIGKTAETYLDEGIDIYRKRINKYVPFEMRIIPDVKVNGKPDAA
ncbi:MAG TPA: 23S rRNA (pseudouridine(1915)-N(3))-methyltransferase RlmH, partial [Saprospiraceae bacterium]|nr:23S rRNA (pseudouridine(1915)-N(3))-methyltransferase RlmH [Saprospiraceae bacterium]